MSYASRRRVRSFLPQIAPRNALARGNKPDACAIGRWRDGDVIVTNQPSGLPAFGEVAIGLFQI